MPKQLNVDLKFSADTSQAKREIQQLQESLSKLMAGSANKGIFNGVAKDIQEAEIAVAKLQVALDKSLNTNTGQLDLSKFSTQLGKAGLDIESLATHMQDMGADGQKAFLNLASSIVSAQKPVRETNAMLNEM